MISILISSDFLGMDQLVGECLLFVRNHINEIIRMPIDLNCLQPNLISKLATFLDDGHLEDIEDESDKIGGKIFGHKFDMLLNQKRDQVKKCATCNAIFMACDWHVAVCEKTCPIIDFRGNVFQRHTPDPNWSLEDHVQSFKSKIITPKQRFWKLWGITHSFWCVNCNQKFLAADTKKCFSHPIPPQYRSGQNLGRYPCCGNSVQRFNNMTHSKGCIANYHVLPSSKDGELEIYDDPLWVQLLLNHEKDFVCNSDAEIHDNKIVKGQSSSRGEVVDSRKPRDKRKKKVENDDSTQASSRSKNIKVLQ